MAYVRSAGTLNSITKDVKHASRGAFMEFCSRLCLIVLLLSSSLAFGQEQVAAVPSSGELPPEISSESLGDIQHGDQPIYPPQRDGALYFGKGSADLSPDAQNFLYRLAEQLKIDRRRSVALTAYLEGAHIDSLEIAATNMRLKVVSTVLQEFGVLAQQLISRIEYESDATSPCATETCRVSYRRVELRVKVPPRKSAKRH